jgi:hypothetical protein
MMVKSFQWAKLGWRDGSLVLLGCINSITSHKSGHSAQAWGQGEALEDMQELPCTLARLLHAGRL